MAAKHFDNAGMLQVTQLALGEHAPALAAPDLARVRRDFEGLLPDLLAIQAQERTGSRNVAAQTADAQHDALARALLLHLDAFVLTAPTPDEAHALAAARRRILPAGRRTVKRAFAKKAAEATLAPARVHATDLDLLRALPLAHHDTMFGLYEAWLAACAELGHAEVKRASLPVRGARLVSVFLVRNRFVRLIARFRLIADVPGGETNALIAAIAVMEAEADARIRARKS